MDIDENVVKRISKLSKLNLSEAEVKSFAKDFNSILHHFESLSEIKKLPDPSFHPIPLQDSMREDDTEDPFTQEEALKNAKNKEKGLFKGPRAV